jgi:hypothetical protein
MTVMPKLDDLSGIAPVTDAEASRLVSPAAFADLAARIVATEAPATEAPATRPAPARNRSLLPSPRVTRPGAPRPRRRLALLTGFPVALAAVAALLVTVLSPGSGTAGHPGGGAANGNANSSAAIQALSFTKEKGTITVIIKNPYADAAWYNADLARHHIPMTLQVVPASPSLVGSIIGGNYAPGVKELTGQRRCYYPGDAGTSTPCLIGFTVPVNLHDEGSVWVGGPAKPGQQYETTGSVFAPGEALAGLLAQVAAQPMSKVRPILASRHVKIAVLRDKNNKNVNPDSVPGSDYVTNITPWAPGQVMIWTSPVRSWSGSERVNAPGALPPGTGAQPVKATPSRSTSH